MDPVQQEQVRDQLVVDKRLAVGDVSGHAGEPLAVQVEQGAHQLGRDLACDRVGEGLDLLEQHLDPLAPVRVLCRSVHRHECSPNIGEWTFLSVLPFPRYMCTPHGRHGSKLRTARMMSMPRKSSWLFSSKIGWPITASS